MFGIIEHMIYWYSIAWPISATQCTDLKLNLYTRRANRKISINHPIKLLNHVITKLN